MSDYLVRGMSMDGFVKVAAICSTELVRRGAQIQKTTPNATAAFGRALTAASMMGNMQKVENGSMTLQIRGGGPIGTITVVSDAVGNVRGCVTEPDVPLVEKYPGKLDVGATVGTDGTLTVIRDLQMKEPYIGSVQLVSGEIGDDVTAYFVQSEQMPTACALGVLVDRDHTRARSPAGYLIQLLPGAPDEIIDKLEAGIQRAGAVTPMLEQRHDSGGHPGAGLRRFGRGVYGDGSRVAISATAPGSGWSRRSSAWAGKELGDIVREGKAFPVECQFCDTVYDLHTGGYSGTSEESLIILCETAGKPPFSQNKKFFEKKAKFA